jgi:hypothetical protein
MLICVILKTPFPPEQKTAFSAHEKKTACRGVASGEAGNNLADEPLADQRQKNAILYDDYPPA